MYKSISKELLEFIKSSPSCFHTIQTIKEKLNENGFTEISENEKWQLAEGGKYYVSRNGSSLAAFKIPDGSFSSWRIIASHSDSPTFKIKENPEITDADHYVRLNVERYGGMTYSPWLDRPLSVAGRVIIKSGDSYEAKLVDVDRDLLLIPNIAIHMNHGINEGYKYSPQKDLLPIYSDISGKDTFADVIAQSAGVEKESILSHDLFLYNRQPGTLWGASEEFISSPKLDDLQCAFASLKGFIESDPQKNCALYCIYDNEEVGSGTKQGAASTFLKDVLSRISLCLGHTAEDHLIALSRSFMISADNAHAAHPAHMDKADPVNKPYINEGIVIKYNADQKYCTDGFSAAHFKDLCLRADVPFQTFTNRSDISGGSTLGNISSTQVAVSAVDIGLPQLAMHSPYETAGVKDTAYLTAVSKIFFD